MSVLSICILLWLYRESITTYLFFELCSELDDSTGSAGLHSRVLSTFLNHLDGISAATVTGSISKDRADAASDGSVLVICACSNADDLDDALVRPG